MLASSKMPYIDVFVGKHGAGTTRETTHNERSARLARDLVSQLFSDISV
jgi:hypothetical protein